MGLETDISIFHIYVVFRQVDAAVVGYAHQRNVGFKFVVLENCLALEGLDFMREELNNNLFIFAVLKDSFFLVRVESLG